MIGTVKTILMVYATLDLTLQVVFQLPAIGMSTASEDLGFRKIWTIKDHNGNVDPQLTFDKYVKRLGTIDAVHMQIDWQNFVLQLLNCFIIAVILLQSEVFNSTGYLKFVTQSGGSMDLLMNLADTKAKAITYCQNNFKIKKIISIQ